MHDEEGSVEPAEETSSPDVTEGSESSPETVEDQREQALEEFHKEFGGSDPEDDPVDEPEEEAEPVAAEAESEEEVETAEQVEETDERIPDEDFKALPEKVRGRIGHLSSKLRDAKQELSALSQRAETDRKAVEALNDFTKANNLTGNDVENGLRIMSMLQNGNMEGFYEAITPFYEMASQALGKTVAPDVQKLIDDGELTEEAGARVTQAERAKELAEAQAQRAEAVRQQQEQQQGQQAHVNALKQAITDTEVTLKQSDPDYALKEQTLKATLTASLRNGLPKDANAMTALVKEIHGSIQIPRATPKPTPPRPSATSGTPRTTAPKTTLEATELAWEQMQAR